MNRWEEEADAVYSTGKADGLVVGLLWGLLFTGVGAVVALAFAFQFWGAK